MPLLKPLALRRLSTLSVIACLLSACAGTPPTPLILAALKCGGGIPPSYREPVAGVALSSIGGTLGSHDQALDGQTARLDQANGRTADVIHVVDDCDKRNAELLKSVQPKKGLFR